MIESRFRPRTLVSLLVVSLLLLSGCSRFKKPLTEAGATEQPKLSRFAYINEGRVLHLIVDVRAARIGGHQDFLPLQIALLNRSKQDLVINRESFTLETPDRTLLPLASYEEFERDYPRHRVDLRIGRELIETLGGRYPAPPFKWRDLAFFPLRESGTVPRDEISLRQGEMAIGYVYFRLAEPGALPDPGKCKLLLSPTSLDDEFVVDVRAYKFPKDQRGRT